MRRRFEMKRLMTELGFFGATLVLGLGAVFVSQFLFGSTTSVGITPLPPAIDNDRPGSACRRKGTILADTRAVYDLVLEKERRADETIVMSEMTSRGGEIMDEMVYKTDWPWTRSDTYSDFKRRNEDSQSLRGTLTYYPGLVFWAREESNAVFTDMNGWKKFYELHPNSGGILTLSAVGFSNDGTQALVYFARTCGSLCGEGSLYILNKVNGVWMIQRKQNAWVS